MVGAAEDKAAKDRRSLAEFIEKAWGQVEKSVEDAVQKSVSRIKVPRRESLQEFSARLDRLEKRISQLEGKGS